MDCQGRIDLLGISQLLFSGFGSGANRASPYRFRAVRRGSFPQWIYLVRAFIEKLSKARNENEAYSFVCAWLTNRDRLDEPGLRQFKDGRARHAKKALLWLRHTRPVLALHMLRNLKFNHLARRYGSAFFRCLLAGGRENN